MYIRLLASGLVTGFGGGLTSLGGGTLMIPLLTEWIGMSRFEARGTAMAASFFTAVSGTVIYGLHGNEDWCTLLWTGLCTGRRAHVRRLAAKPAAPPVRGGDITKRAGAARPRRSACRLRHRLAAALAGAVGVGGVSGGPVLAPLFALGLGMTQQLAQGSSLVLRLPAILGGMADNQREGTVRWGTLPWLALGIVIGTAVGGVLAIHLPERILRWLFTVVLMLLGLHEIGGRPMHPHVDHRPHGTYP